MNAFTGGGGGGGGVSVSGKKTVSIKL